MRSHTCPKCQGTMTEGFLLDTIYDGNKVGQWFEGIPQIGFLGSVKLRGRKKFDVRSWRCERCGFLENYARI
jgi:Domain of unknown function (DUF6487)